MDNENRNDVLATENPQDFNQINNMGVGTSLNNGPIIETIPDNNIEEQINNNTQTDPIEILSVEPNLEPSQDNFYAVPIPPIFETENKKPKKNNKLIFIILIVVLIAGVGFGIYYFLTMAKTKAPIANVNIKEIKLELGNEISQNIDDYVTITGYNRNDCTLDTKNISTNKVGTYKFYVSCGSQKVEGTAIVDDTTSPEVITNEVIVLPNSTVAATDFIDSCLDASICTYKISDEENLKTSLKEIGEHNIEIIVSDEYNNKNTITAKLIVALDAPVRYVSCTSKSEDIDDIYATLTNTYRFGISMNNKIYNITRNSEFSFTKIEDYNKVKNNYNEAIGINNIIGETTFNKNNKSITIKSKKTINDLNNELNLSLTDDINVTQLYLTINGYTCK